MSGEFILFVGVPLVAALSLVWGSLLGKRKLRRESVMGPDDEEDWVDPEELADIEQKL